MRVLAASLMFWWIASTPTLAAPQQPSSASPRFDEGPCPFAADASVLQQVRCGSLSVLENRSRPDGPRLKIAVAVLKSLSATPKPDPIVWLAGGPGESAVVRAADYIRSGVLNHWRAERDIVLYDQRGAGSSEPRLCPEEAPNWQGRPNQEDGAAFRARRREVAARCSESVRRAGFDLSQYNSAVSALDLQDLRIALGYAQWNLYGPSYGARLALAAMRDGPQGIRSAILAAPSPPVRARATLVPCGARRRRPLSRAEPV